MPPATRNRIGYHEYTAYGKIPFNFFKNTRFYAKYKDKPCFYVIQPTPCDSSTSACDIGTKLGKSEGKNGATMRTRLHAYQVQYRDFDVKHIRVFTRADAGTHYRINDTPISLAARYEREILRELKAMGVQPLRGNEFFRNYNIIEQAMARVDKRLGMQQVDVFANRKSDRILSNKKDDIIYIDMDEPIPATKANRRMSTGGIMTSKMRGLNSF